MVGFVVFGLVTPRCQQVRRALPLLYNLMYVVLMISDPNKESIDSLEIGI